MRRGRLPSEDELALWRAATRDATPLATPAPARIEPPKAAEPAPPASLPKPAPEPTHRAVPTAAPQPPRLPAPHGVDRRTLQRLKRGLVSIDARLDLHGMTQDEAHRYLTAGIARHQRQGARCLLVITGIGERSTGGTLRRMAPRWLAEPANAARIIAMSPAQKRHGGEGALYVLLRRLR